MNTETGYDLIHTIDCQYEGPRRAAAYLIVENGRAAFVDNNTVHAIPHLLQGMKDAGVSSDQVEYLIITHVHLDHAGGTAALLAHCPNATVLAHERAARHLIDPSRLIAGATQVYGAERFAELYGQIDPIDEARVQIVQDNDTVDLAGRSLEVMYTLGHAKHHMCVFDRGANCVFSGDNFGIRYPDLQNGTRPFVFCAAAPTDFDPVEAKKSVQRILDTGADAVHVGHFGTVPDPAAVALDLLRSIDRMEAVQREAKSSGVSDDELATFCERRVQEELYAFYADTGATLTDADRKNFELDVWLNWNGVHWNAMKARKG